MSDFEIDALRDLLELKRKIFGRGEEYRQVATELGITRRTLNRWCAKECVPGAHKTKGGHWRIPLDVEIKEILRRASSFRKISWERRTYDPIATKVTAATLGLTMKDVENLRPQDERFSQFYHDPVPLTEWEPSAGDIAVQRDPQGKRSMRLRLAIAQRELMALGEDVTMTAIARHMGISRSMLYRKTTKDDRESVVKTRSR